MDRLPFGSRSGFTTADVGADPSAGPGADTQVRPYALADRGHARRDVGADPCLGPGADTQVRPYAKAYSADSGLTRRQFLEGLSLTAVALGAACRKAPYRASDFSVPSRSPVALLPAPHYGVDLADVIYRGLGTLGTQVKGLRVLLKPNLVEYEAGTVINTNASIVAGAAAAFLRAGAREVVVGEGPGHRRDIEYLLVATGLYDHLKEAS